MRSLLLAVVIALLAQCAYAADGGCKCRAARCADKCCGQLTTLHLALSPKPLCKPPRHRAVTPLIPCGCHDAVTLCHKPIVTDTPCGCVEKHHACHKPALAVVPDVDCPPAIELTGTLELVDGCPAPSDEPAKK